LTNVDFCVGGPESAIVAAPAFSLRYIPAVGGRRPHNP
jgi:hypothetical protein